MERGFFYGIFCDTITLTGKAQGRPQKHLRTETTVARTCQGCRTHELSTIRSLAQDHTSRHANLNEGKVDKTLLLNEIRKLSSCQDRENQFFSLVSPVVGTPILGCQP